MLQRPGRSTPPRDPVLGIAACVLQTAEMLADKGRKARRERRRRRFDALTGQEADMSTDFSPEPAPTDSKRSRRTVVVLAVLAALVLLSLMGFVLWQGQSGVFS